MQTFFIQIKCDAGKTYDVANELVYMDLAAEIFSIAGKFDLMAKFHVDNGVDISVYVNDLMLRLKHVQSSETIIAFKAFA